VQIKENTFYPMLESGHSQAPALSSYELEIDEIYNKILEKNLHSRDDKLDHRKGIKEKLNDISKVLFSRESAYRGLIEIFAEDLPSLIVESFRGINSTLEHLFKYCLTTSIIMGVPYFAQFISSKSAKTILNSVDHQQGALALLFNRADLVSEESFEKAKSRILKEEVLDQVNLMKLWGKNSKKTQTHLEKAYQIKENIKKLKNNSSFREEALMLKNDLIQKQTLMISTLSAFVPYLIRLFRKYVLGVDRFTGSINYLNDKNAKKLGSQGFTLKQTLGTIACMFSSPLITKFFVNRFKNQLHLGNFSKLMSEQLDTKHSYFPKIGTYILSFSLPYLISKLFNAQDKYEFAETIVKTSFNGLSLFFGDRVTNGRFAKSADRELQSLHNTKKGILYRSTKDTGGLWSWLKETFPEARKFSDVIALTEHNPKLEKDAIERYQTSFLKGFFSHSVGIAVMKYIVNKITQLRVNRDLKAI
jgi:hypothetical protein